MAAGFAGGAILGAVLAVADYVLRPVQAQDGIHRFIDDIFYGAQPATTIFTMALVTWLSGLLLVGLPLWWPLHRSGHRSWTACVALGFGVSFFLVFAFHTHVFGLVPYAGDGSLSDSGGPTVIGSRLTPHGWSSAIRNSFYYGAEGIVVAWMIWRIMYRRRAVT